MSERIIIVHGLYNHGDNMDPMADALRDRGYEVEAFEYPKRYAFQMYFPWIPKTDGFALAHFMQDGDHIIAHSYGCLIFINSIIAGAKWGKAFLLGGAATSDGFYYPDDAFNEAWVIYNPEDTALKLGAKLPFHPFGHMGLNGITGQPGRETKDYRIRNRRGFRMDGIDHSHYFDKELKQWVRFVDMKIKGG